MAKVVKKEVVKKAKAKEVLGSDSEDFTNDLISSLNREFDSRIAYNLSSDESPTHVKRWISTGSRGLDYICSNRKNGGLPEGRIIEIFGPPSIGKSHIAIQIAKSTQQAGGIVVYIDTENGTSIENLDALGLDVSRRFVYIDTHCTEEVFQVAESTILKVKASQKDIPVTIIWDSVAGSSPKAELDGDYDKDTIGLQARTISKSMRKITGIIGDQNVLFVCLNQIRTKIGVMFGDPSTTPGGHAIPFHASIRIKLGAGQQIKHKNGDVIGIEVSAKTIKNKVAAPFRTCNFQIHFGKGIFEDEAIFELLNEAGPRDIGENTIEVSGSGGWKELEVTNNTTGEVVLLKKFLKANTMSLFSDPETAQYMEDLLDAVYVKKMSRNQPLDIDQDSYVEAQALFDDISDSSVDAINP
jgi:recombination protein RecA